MFPRPRAATGLPGAQMDSSTTTTDEASDPEERPEDFGIDPESATYKYDTGR